MASFVVPPSGGPSPEPPEGGTTNKLKEDVRLLKDLFSRAEANLGQLIGKTIRVAGAGMKVTEVRGGKLIVTGAGGVELPVGPDKLDPEELLKLGLSSADEPKAVSHQEFLFQFFFGQPSKAKTALAKAKAQGVELAFYEDRLAELEQGQEQARAEKEATALVSQIESAIKAEKVETAESKLGKLEKEFGQTQAAKANLARLRESLTDAQSKAAGKKNMVFIPAGKFLYGEGANPQEIDLPAFYIGKYEVSNAEYDEFKAWLKKETEKGEKGDPHRYCYPGYLPDGKELTEEQLKTLEKMTPEKRQAAVQKLGLKGGEPGGKSHENGAAAKPDHPVVNVDWYDAWAYCRWRGGRLPTEQEWEKAASWDPKLKRKRVYPWGDEFVAKFCNSNSAEDGFAQTCPLSEFPKGASAYGCYNMAGNVWEWCDSWLVAAGSPRVGRGGSWGNDASCCRAGFRDAGGPASRYDSFGFRLCRRSYP
jgi:formylglycine-generating enzyme required for sulfatase activity